MAKVGKGEAEKEEGWRYWERSKGSLEEERWEGMPLGEDIPSAIGVAALGGWGWGRGAKRRRWVNSVKGEDEVVGLLGRGGGYVRSLCLMLGRGLEG